MTQYKFRMWDRVKPVHGNAFKTGKVVSSGFGRGSAWYKVEAESGDVFNCREDELELVERVPVCEKIGEGVFELLVLAWTTPDHHPAEGEGIVFIPRDNPYHDIWRGIYRDGKYHVWIITNDDTLSGGVEPFGIDEESILCWSSFVTPEVPEPDGVGQAFSPDAEDAEE